MSNKESEILLTAVGVMLGFCYSVVYTDNDNFLVWRRNGFANVWKKYYDGREPFNADYNIQKEEEEMTRHAAVINALLNITYWC